MSTRGGTGGRGVDLVERTWTDCLPSEVAVVAESGEREVGNKKERERMHCESFHALLLDCVKTCV